MNRKNLYPVFSTLVLLLAIVACVTPGQTVVTPAPVSNPVNIETAVAGTSQAAAAQTQQAIPIPATATIADTPTSTSTPKISLTGTSLVVQEDQSILFIDRKGGFQITLPPSWLAIRINEEEYFNAFTLDVVLANPEINERLTRIRSSNGDYLRLDAIDTRPGHIVKGLICDISVMLHPETADSDSLEEWARIEKDSVRNSIVEGHKLLSSKFQQVADGTRILVVEESWNYTPEDKVFLRRVFFDLPSAIVTLDFQANIDFKDTVLPEFEQVVNSLTLITP